MPLYRCNVAQGLTRYEQRSRIAKEVTRIHCEVTQAPPSFVHTFFAEDLESALPAGKRAFLLGSIRSGRSAEQKQAIASQMSRALTEILGIPENEISVVLADLPARWVMEGGDVLPEPGEEAAWLARHG